MQGAGTQLPVPAGISQASQLDSDHCSCSSSGGAAPGSQPVEGEERLLDLVELCLVLWGFHMGKSGL